MTEYRLNVLHDYAAPTEEAGLPAFPRMIGKVGSPFCLVRRGVGAGLGMPTSSVSHSGDDKEVKFASALCGSAWEEEYWVQGVRPRSPTLQTTMMEDSPSYEIQ